MHRETIGLMELNISDDMSGVVNIKRYDDLRRMEADQNHTSKIDRNFNNKRGFQK